MTIVYGTENNSRDWSDNFNELMLKKGYARVNEKYLPKELEYFKDLENEAKTNNFGIWEKN